MRRVSGSTDRYIPCAWWDCHRDGDDKYESVHREGTRWVHYLFCVERHRELWRNSPRDHGNLPTGSRGLLGPR